MRRYPMVSNEKFNQYAIVLGATEGKVLKFLHEEITIKLKSPNLEILEGIVAPHAGPPLHIHINQDEAFYVLEGEFAFKTGEEPIKVINSGGFVFITRNTPHSYKNVGENVGKILTIMTPGGFVEFWEEVAQLPSGKVNIDKVNEIGKKYGNINVGRPL
jgi:quercetin dioxygenase-like cupin family protein